MNRVEHIHVHFGTNSATVAMLCRKMGGPTYSMTIHGPEEFDSPLAIALDEKIRHAKFVVAISSYCRSQLFRWIPFSDWKKIKEVHCAVNEGFLAKENIEFLEPKRFLSVGRLCEQKGQMLLLEAFQKVYQIHKDAQLHLVGDGEFREAIEAYISENGLKNNVHLLGWKSSDEIAEQMDKCSAMVLPSFAEGLPVVIMEALARKRPVISTFIAAIPELIDNRCGWLVPAGNAHKLSEVMLEVINTPSEQLYSMGCIGFNRILAEHNSILEAKKLQVLFKE
jgi:colanic acid/amylovoran biosynthesis glycosyltransferase